MICFKKISMKLSLSHDLGHRFDGLTLVDSGHFFMSFLNQFFFLISSFNTKLIEN